ncbi:DoxX family protein [uncultured Lacinutrix sp.]|uniref:DoxX family protein n=1 Tax=uncultured Lacinutrix sp. TaxID=574032 RepID=UPI00261DDEF8|nr:DoxX family protein [uncultured Lacinutrix sp.]
MGTVKSLNKWANTHTYYPIDILRIALGVFLFIKGFQFMQNIQALNAICAPLEKITGGMLALHLIIPAHLIGGLLIVFGLLTRWAMAVQIPLLIGAIILNFIGDMNTSNLILASITLLVCIFFLFYGSGKHSADYYLKMQQ